MNVRHIRQEDLHAAAAWLREHAEHVTTSGIKRNFHTREILATLMQSRVIWVAIHQGALVGILSGAPNIRMVVDDQERTAWGFRLLATSWEPDATPQQQLRIADTLVVEAHKDIIGAGWALDYIWVCGPQVSPSARYCRVFLNMEEEVEGRTSYFLKPFMEIVDGPHSRDVF